MMSFKIDTSNFDRSLRELMRTSRKTGQAVLMDQARLFVRDVVAVTPPNQDFQMRMGRGNAKVRGDIGGVMAPTRRETNLEPALVHKRFRSMRSGRVNTKLEKKRKIRVNRDELREYVAKKVARVGFLAAGWVAAGRKLGTRLPGWITRHGSMFGSVIITLSWRGMAIKMANIVPYAGNVDGMQRRVQVALDNRSRQIDKRLADYAVKQAARRAGFKVK